MADIEAQKLLADAILLERACGALNRIFHGSRFKYSARWASREAEAEITLRMLAKEARGEAENSHGA